MRVPTTQELLRELNQINRPQGLRLLGELGHGNAGQPELTGLIRSLNQGDSYSQLVALQLAIHAHDEKHVLTALTSRSIMVQRLAGKHAPIIIRDKQAFTKVFLAASPFLRGRMIESIRRSGRGDLAEPLFHNLLSRFGEQEASRLLAWCYPDTIADHLPRLAHCFGGHWRAFALRHPVPLLGFIRTSFSHEPKRHHSALWWRFATAMPQLARTDPAALARLLLDFAPENEIPDCAEAVLGTLTRRVAPSVLSLLLRPGYRTTLVERGLPRAVLANLRHFTDTQLQDLANLLIESTGMSLFLSALPPSRRGALFKKATPTESSYRIWPTDLLAALPHALRHRECLRMMGLRTIRGDRERCLEITSMAGFSTALPILEAEACSAVPEQRANALRLLINACGHERGGLSEALDFLQRLRNEQDPVRSAAYGALAWLPPSLFNGEHVVHLQALVRFAIEARDTSRLTQGALENLASKLLVKYARRPEHELFQFALETLVKLAGNGGPLLLPKLTGRLPRGAEQQLFSALEPLLNERSERNQLILHFGDVLGKRAYDLSAYQKHLESLLHCNSELAREAIELWLKPSQTRNQRVEALLAEDPSAIAVAPVFQHLHRYRVDLLDPYLTGKPLRGKFLDGQTPFLPPAHLSYAHWLPRHQRTLAALLDKRIEEKVLDRQRAKAIKRKACLPAMTVSDLEPLLDHPNILLSEATIHGLSYLDQPETGLPILLNQLDGARARVAVYALPRCARFLGPDLLSSLLSDLLARHNVRITVRKEAIRLLGSVPGPAGLVLLSIESKRKPIHRDVRIAIGHAIRRRLDEEAVWPLLERIAEDEDPQVVASLLDPRDLRIAERHRRRYGRFLLRLTQHENEHLRLRATRSLTSWSCGLEEEIVPVFCRKLLDLEDTPEWKDAVDVLVAIWSDGSCSRSLVDTVRILAGISCDKAYNGCMQRDLPARQRLDHLVKELCRLRPSQRTDLAPSFRRAATALYQVSSLVGRALELDMAATTPSQPQVFLTQLREMANTCHSRPLLISDACKALRRRMEELREFTDFAMLDSLATDDNPVCGLFAREVIAEFGPKTKWSKPYRAKLIALRAHKDPDVRTAAMDLTTHSETPPYATFAGFRGLFRH